jgi:hypothetical protein
MAVVCCRAGGDCGNGVSRNSGDPAGVFRAGYLIQKTVIRPMTGLRSARSMANIPDVPIDWASVSWLYVAVLALLVFVSTLLGTLLSFRRLFLGAGLSAVLFAVAFVFWTYYPHGLPLPTTASAQKGSAAPGTPAAPPPQAAPAVKPANPVTTISPAQ